MTADSYTDPLAFDYGIGFKSAAERVKGERDRRLALAARQMPFHHPFLDDCLRSIMPHDYIIVGARTGCGKTELARSIAASNAAAGKRVGYFALEAEADEIERRTKYGILSALIYEHGIRLGKPFAYSDWYRGAHDGALRELEDEADQLMAERYKTLLTYYRGQRFNHEDVRRLLLAQQDSIDLFVLDHLHYVDIDDDNENRGMKETVKAIRNSALLVGKPVIMVVHLRKRERASKALMPTPEDIHGSSDIAKECTHTIMLEPARSVPATSKYHANTFFTVVKDRGEGANYMLALCQFDRRTKSYAEHYTLGRDEGGKFEPLGTSEVPFWAERHEPLSDPYGAADSLLRGDE